MSRQATLDEFLNRSEHGEEELQSARTAVSAPQNLKPPFDLLEIFDDTISCIELDMKHDKNGNVIGWMEGEPKVYEWDGSIDNKIKTLEDHVGKKGWMF